MRLRTAIGVTAAVLLLGAVLARSRAQGPVVRPVDEATLREYAGVYQWEPEAFLYLQLWAS
jgi:hypothetical protein